MRKVSLLFAFAVAGFSAFAQYNTPQMQEAQLLKSQGDINNAKSTITTPNRASGDVIYNFDFTDGMPAGWTTTDDAGIGGWTIHSGLVDEAAYVSPASHTINSVSGGNYLYMPVEYYNTVPGSDPAADNTDLVDGDATVTTDWMDVSAYSDISLKYLLWGRHWYGTFEIYLYINGDATTPVATLDGLNINGQALGANDFPGPSSATPTPGDGNNGVVPVYPLTAAAGQQINSVKLAFRFSATSHYVWEIDDVQIIETPGNDLALNEVYARNFGIYTMYPFFTGSTEGVYTGYNTNYSETPHNLINQLSLGGLLHESGAAAENGRIEFSIDSIATPISVTGVAGETTVTSTTTVPSLTTDTILITDTVGGSGPVVRQFFSPQLTAADFTGSLLDNGIPYVFHYNAVSDNADLDMTNNSQDYEYAQTWGRYSYHWQPTDNSQVQISGIYTPFQYNIGHAQGDLFMNEYECYTGNAGESGDFKIYGMRFFLAASSHTTWDASGNGVEVRPVLYTYDSSISDWVEIDAFVYADGTMTLNQSQENTWIYMEFDNSAGDVDNYDFLNGDYRIGLYIEDYHSQEFALGEDNTYRQPFGHTISFFDGDWGWLGTGGAVMIDMYTQADQFNHDANVNVKEVKNSTMNNVRVYPNPTTGIIKVQNAENATINIYSLAGNLVKTIESNAVSTSVDLSEFAKGTYLVKVVKANEVVTKKVNLLK